MDTIKKKCTKCGIEKAATHEFFSTNNSCPDKLERWCKTCKAKAQKDRLERIRKQLKRDPKPIRKAAGALVGAAPPKTLGPQSRHVRSAAVEKATPDEILIALRKGIAAEIITMLKETYRL